MNPETEGKISLLVTFIQRFFTESKLSLIFTKTPYFQHKTTCFSNNSHNAYKNADDNSKFNITEINPWKLTFWKQPVIAKDEIKVSVILANKSEVKARISSSPSLFTVTSLLQHFDYFLLYTRFFLLRRLFLGI